MRGLSLYLCLGLSAGCSQEPSLPPAPVTLAGYDLETAFAEGLAVVREGATGRLGYIDARGTVVIPPRFSGAQPFAEGRAAVALNGRYGYIDRRGEWLVPPRYLAATAFVDSLGAVAAPVAP
ncbi:MAG: WG repeat-containing protein [Candidatus Competibacterales bacterium]